MCLYPQFIKNPKYKQNNKNNGYVHQLPDQRIEYTPAPCGKCMECKRQEANKWRIRLMEEIKTTPNAKFVTLTFSNDSITKLLLHNIRRTNTNTGAIETIRILDLRGYERDNQIATKAIRLFNERWRKKNKKALRHWLITELGHKGTENIHLHGIIWTTDMKQIEETWQYGWIWKGYKKNGQLQNYVNNKTINYITKYVTKTDLKHKEYKPKILTSPGIGANYLKTHNAKRNTYNGHQTIETYKTQTGHEMALPTYYRNKLYTDEEREKLWIHKLDQETRYVDKQKIDISKTDKEYKEALQRARQKNTQLGYGQRTNENRKQYEEDRREIMIQTRIKKTPSARS